MSAFILLPIVIGLIAWGGLPFACLVGVVAGWAVYEVCAMALRPTPPTAWTAVVVAAVLPVYSGLHPARLDMLLLAFAFGCFLALAAGFVSALLSPNPVTAVSRAMWMPASLVYCALPLGLIGLLRMGRDGLWWVILACTLTWMNYTGAFFVGRAFGRHKLLPKVSPNKTWEGFFGGWAVSAAAAWAVKVIGFQALPAGDCLALGLLAGVVGPVGDLSESLLKRSLDVKDSGRLLPGHGGILDRIDALLFNGVLVFAYADAFGRL
jgi:phosphatidate cytidylyltransferase